MPRRQLGGSKQLCMSKQECGMPWDAQKVKKEGGEKRLILGESENTKSAEVCGPCGGLGILQEDTSCKLQDGVNSSTASTPRSMFQGLLGTSPWPRRRRSAVVEWWYGCSGCSLQRLCIHTTPTWATWLVCIAFSCVLFNTETGMDQPLTSTPALLLC
jgi:hypothetical protein